jgi:hypothetical protein
MAKDRYWEANILRKTQPVKKFPAFYGTRSFITVFTWNFYPKHCVTFRNKLLYYGEKLVAPRPNPKLEDYPLSTARNCLVSIFHQ